MLAMSSSPVHTPHTHSHSHSQMQSPLGSAGGSRKRPLCSVPDDIFPTTATNKRARVFDINDNNILHTSAIYTTSPVAAAAIGNSSTPRIRKRRARDDDGGDLIAAGSPKTPTNQNGFVALSQDAIGTPCAKRTRLSNPSTPPTPQMQAAHLNDLALMPISHLKHHHNQQNNQHQPPMLDLTTMGAVPTITPATMLMRPSLGPLGVSDGRVVVWRRNSLVPTVDPLRFVRPEDARDGCTGDNAGAEREIIAGVVDAGDRIVEIFADDEEYHSSAITTPSNVRTGSSSGGSVCGVNGVDGGAPAFGDDGMDLD